VGLRAWTTRTPRQRHTNAPPVPAESTDGIELASATERVTAAKVEALGPQVEGHARHVCRCCHENKTADLVHCEGARAKSICCVEGI
jgi:hypothetical protein